ncbi:hypothetical protein M9H77_21164 [Catharanthus roseus]|uniref:Uncharacterized protein n=1 Tax=Catharanthus roseus TaxID=4058 RepID=A0ACC0AM95_CATRO|nr:hypothetical protein M9H77_21164 [Catharanthus roseus]
MSFPGMTRSHNSRHTTSAAYCASIHPKSIKEKHDMEKCECKRSVSPPNQETSAQLLPSNSKENVMQQLGSTTKSGSHNEVIRNKFRHLVVNTSETPYERSIP